MIPVQTILGIDPALGTTGYGIIACEGASFAGSQVRLVDAGVIRCPRDEALECRLEELYRGLTELLGEFQPQALAIEQLYSHYDRPTTAILMGHARGVIMLAAAHAKVPVFSYAATQIKKTLTGAGRASKAQMQLAVQHQLRLGFTPNPPDVADALAIALTHRHFSLSPASQLRISGNL